MTFLPSRELLSFDEIVRVAGVARGLGVTSVRLTGGEPLVRKGLSDLVARLATLGFDDLALTTNGMLLAPLARPAGSRRLRRVNISCDSLRAERFGSSADAATSTSCSQAMDAAEAAGLTPLKVNVVLLRGRNDDEILDFASFARDHRPDRAVHRVHAAGRRADVGPEPVGPGSRGLRRSRPVWPLEPMIRYRQSGTGRAVSLLRRWG